MRNIFISAMLVISSPALSFSPLNGCSSIEQEEISVNEDLMQEHGVLNRLLLVYEEVAKRIDNDEPFEIDALAKAAVIVRNFLEDHHEKLEEEYIFTKFEEAGKQLDLVKTLRQQHDTGRILTDFIIDHANDESLKDEIQKTLLSGCLKLYIRMFRPHEAREDTIIFPEFKQLVSKEEYDRLGELFEAEEHRLFGDDPFESIVKSIEEIEKSLGIYDLNEFTPF